MFSFISPVYCSLKTCSILSRYVVTAIVETSLTRLQYITVTPLINRKTCKSLYYLTTVKSFWLSCAKLLAQRRRVHFLPLEELDIPQLRTAIIHTLKLDLKWSGTVDPSPVRSIEIDPTSHTTGLPVESQAVTWVWFLDDGIHLTCIVGDTIVQVWNLHDNRPILSFSVDGTLVRASQYSDKDHFVMVGSVNPPIRADNWNQE
jgi:hypothetical protein